MAQVPVLEHQWKAWLASRDIAVPSGVFIPYEGEELQLPDTVAELRPPLVLKAVSSTIVHKSDVGAVRLGLPGAAAAEEVARRLLADLVRQGIDSLDGLLIEEMVPAGIELLLGLRRDPQFGRLLSFGVGGIMVEALGEARFFALPLRPFDVDTVLASQPWLERTLQRLGGAGITALHHTLWRFGGPHGIALEPRLEALEINPLLVGTYGATAVDVRGRMTSEA